MTIRSLATVALVGVGISCLLPACGGSGCSNESKSLIATAYAAAVSYPEKFPTWAGENQAALSGDEFNTCIERMADQLMSAALSAPSRDDIYASAMRTATDAGAPELGGKVADDMYKSSMDLYRLAGQLRQLKTCISSGLSGDWSGFSQSEFQLMTFVWNMSEQQLGSEYTRNLRKVSFDLQRWYALQLAGQMK